MQEEIELLKQKKKQEDRIFELADQRHREEIELLRGRKNREEKVFALAEQIINGKDKEKAEIFHKIFPDLNLMGANSLVAANSHTAPPSRNGADSDRPGMA